MSTQKKNRQQLQYLRDEALQAYLNREDFQYDLNGDALYQQYKDRYIHNGQRAMQDTMGQAASLTGGYGSSYAQSVGQQAYNSYLQQLGDVIPELYQLAYDRYRDEGDRLYKNYQSWAQLEQEAADEEQWEREYELEERKRQDANAQFELEWKSKNGNGQTELPQSDYYAWLYSLQGKGERPDYNNPTNVTEYDNQHVTTGNIMILQRILGMPETGMWTVENRRKAEGLLADDAWEAYQKGQFQSRYFQGVGGEKISQGDVRSMERVLGLEEDGIWSKEDIQAVGGLTLTTAWDAYKKGLLQLRRKT